jgi:hypothetical protein
MRPQASVGEAQHGLFCGTGRFGQGHGLSLPMRMTASWFGSLDLPHTRLWRDSTAPESGLPSDCHPHHRARIRQDEAGEIQPRDRARKNASPCLTQKAPYKGLCADSVEKHEPASDIAIAVVDSLKALDPDRPIREADITGIQGSTGMRHQFNRSRSLPALCREIPSRTNSSTRE